MQALGHIVLKVQDLRRSECFYSGLLGMRIISRIPDPPMTFFSLGTPGSHHDFALMEIRASCPNRDHDAPGLAHVAFKVGSSEETLRLVREVLHSAGTTVLYEARRAFTKSIHVLDPDENEIELYIDT